MFNITMYAISLVVRVRHYTDHVASQKVNNSIEVVRGGGQIIEKPAFLGNPEIPLSRGKLWILRFQAAKDAKAPRSGRSYGIFMPFPENSQILRSLLDLQRCADKLHTVSLPN